MDPGKLKDEIAGLATLDEPVRRALYLYVAAQPADVSRDQAAHAVGTSRSLAGFHLDRLADEGLLDVSYRRLSGRTGPGAGRPAKLYRRSSRQLEISLPPRSYELAASILASTVEATKGSETVRQALEQTARETGARLAENVASIADGGDASEPRDPLDRLDDALVATGFEPEHTAGTIRLRNCPFHALAEQHRQLVCGMNLALVDGLLSGLGVETAKTRLDPRPGECCVCIDVAPR